MLLEVHRLLTARRRTGSRALPLTIAAGLIAAARPAAAQQPQQGCIPEPLAGSPTSGPPLLTVGAYANTPPPPGGIKPFIFAVTLVNAVPGRTVQVPYTTTDGDPSTCAPFTCAKAGVDYVPTAGTLVFSPGGPMTQVVKVNVRNSGVPGPNKIFFFLIADASGAISTDPLGIGRIINQTPPAATAGSATIQEFPLDCPGHGGGIVLDPNGIFWTTEQQNHRLASFDPIHLTSAQYDLLSPTVRDPYPHFIIVGPDGNLWFTDLHSRVGTFDLKTHVATFYSQGITPNSVPHLLLYNKADGNFYWSEEREELDPNPGGRNKTFIGKSAIAQMNPTTKVITEYNGLFPTGSRLHGMEVTPDGNIWAGLEGLDELVRFNITTKQIDRVVNLPAGGPHGPHDLLLGPDNNIYVVCQTSNQLAQFNPQTGAVQMFSFSLTPQDGPSMVFLTVGPDKKSLWFSEFLNDRVGRFDLVTHQFTEFSNGITPGSGPIGIAVGPDNNIWFTEPVFDQTKPGRMARLIVDSR